jgi:hypothetical protein
MAGHLRLRAVDADDLKVIAACLQDALIPLGEMAYMAEERRFLAAFCRFCRERQADDGTDLAMCQAALAIEEVETVRFRGIDPEHGRVRFELLTILAETGADGRHHITLVFAGDILIQVQARAIKVTLRDFGEPWPAGATPCHELTAAQRDALNADED